MMKLMSLFDNPFFLKHWYVRMRKVSVGAEVAAVLMTFVTVALTASVFGYESFWKIMLATFMLAQGLLLIVIVPYRVGQAAIEEQRCHTLDFHRTSPTPTAHYLFGAIFAPGVLEWIIAAAILPLLITAGVLEGAGPTSLLFYTLSLVLTSTLFASLSTMLGFDAGVRTLNRPGTIAGLATVMPSLYFIIALISLTNHRAGFLGALIGTNGVDTLLADAEFSSFADGRLPMNSWWLMGLQLLVQIPVMLIILAGVWRAFRQPGTFLMSKRMILASCCAFLLDIFLVAKIDIVPTDGGMTAQGITLGILVIGSLLLVGICTIFAAPDRLQHSRAIMRALRLGHTRLRWFDDGAAIFPFVFLCMAVILAGTAMLSLMGLVESGVALLGRFTLVLVLCGWLTMSWQWVLLRWGVRSRPIYVLTLVFVCMVLPIIGAIISREGFFWFALVSPYSIVMVITDSTRFFETSLAIPAVAVTHVFLLVSFSYLVWNEVSWIRRLAQGKE